MKVYNSHEIKNIALLGNDGSGKTTLTESLLFESGLIKKRGRITQKNTVSDLENVGYSKPDEEGLYNVFMMADAHTVFGVGAGSTTKLVFSNEGKTEIKRIFSPKYPYEYLQDNQNKYKEVKKEVKR